MRLRGLMPQRESLEDLEGQIGSLPSSTPCPGETCTICLEDFGVERVKKLACSHCYHAECLMKWVRHGGRIDGAIQCPLCKHSSP